MTEWLMKLTHKLQSYILNTNLTGEQESAPIHVALFVHSLERNGANNFSLYLAQKLASPVCTFDIYAPKDGPMKHDFEELDMKVVLKNPSDEDFLEYLENTLVTDQYSLVIANTIMKCDVITVCNKNKMPSVWVIHEAWPPAEFEYYAKEVFNMSHIDADRIREAFAVANKIVFPSNIQKNIYTGLFKEKNAMTIYNGIPLEQLDDFVANNKRDEVRRKLGYGPKDFLILHLGTICRRKGQLYTARSFVKLVREKKVRRAKLLMVGARYIRNHEIQYINKIKKIINYHHLDEKVTIMDIQKDVRRFYVAADVVVVPSLNEVLPLVICEAMACKRPVIASRIDGIPEALADGVEGFLIPAQDIVALTDCVHELYKSPQLRQEFGENGRARVLEQFSYDRMAEHYKDVIESVIEEIDNVSELSEMDDLYYQESDETGEEETDEIDEFNYSDDLSSKESDEDDELENESNHISKKPRDSISTIPIPLGIDGTAIIIPQVPTVIAATN